MLSSGLHSAVFLQKMAIFTAIRCAPRGVCGALGRAIEALTARSTTSSRPAIGGIVPGYETARALGAKAIFVERDPGKPFALRAASRSRRVPGR